MDEDIIENQGESLDIWTEFIYHEPMGINNAISNGCTGRLLDGDVYQLRWIRDRNYIGIYGRVWVSEMNGTGQMVDLHSHGWILDRIDNTGRDIVEMVLSTKVKWIELR